MSAWLRKLAAAAVFSWWVVTYTGTPVAGPFLTLQECQDSANYPHVKYTNVSTVCQYH
jgi:hypothetical protein